MRAGRLCHRGILGAVTEPDLFVVCKNCSSEVSPYVTECPYCGQRVRKRAPKIERGAPTEEPRVRRRRARPKPPTLSRMRRDEIPGIALETRPYAVIALIVVALLATLVTSTGRVSQDQLGAIGAAGIDGDWWRIVTTPFVYSNGGYEFVALVAIGIFGTLIERRFGSVAALWIFLLAGAGGAALAVALDASPVLGGNGAALGLLTAWFVDDRLSARRGTDRENDLIGVYVIAALLLLVPVAEPDASFYAGLGGAAVGAIVATVMSPFRP
jgi:membrane associated rhomboid family serine protease